MMEDLLKTPTLVVIFALYVASLVHVFWESMTKQHVGYPFMHVVMCALVVWPFAYLWWIIWWPGSLRQLLFGSDKRRIERRVRLYLQGKREKFW